MKTSILMFVLSIFAFKNGYGQVWNWARNNGGFLDDVASSVTTDATGNVYVTGYFESDTISFGSTVFTKSNCVGSANIFLVKYDSLGNIIWARDAGGGSDDEGKSVATDGAGNIYVTGYFQSSTIVFGTITLVKPSNGHIAMFIVKYDSSGNVLWAKGTQDSLDVSGTSVTVDLAGNVYVCGNTYSPMLSFGADTLVNAGECDMFLVKYDPLGNVIWDKSAGGTSNDWSNSVTTDLLGNVYLVGNYESSSVIFGSTTFTNAGSADVYVVKYDSTGNVIWARNAGGSSYEVANSVCTDSKGNVYITGCFQSPSITFGSTTFTDPGSADLFLVKYDSMGNVKYAQRSGALADMHNCLANSVTIDDNDNALIAGLFYSPSIIFGSTTLTNASDYSDLFIVKYDSIGDVLFADRVGGSNYENAKSITIDKMNDVYIAGYFSSPTVVFGATTVTNYSNSDDIFLAKCINLPLSAQSPKNEFRGIEIFPNPAFSTLTIKSIQPINHIEISNLIGQNVLSIEGNQKEQVQVDVSKLSGGMYYLTVNGTEVRRFIKE